MKDSIDPEKLLEAIRGNTLSRHLLEIQAAAAKGDSLAMVLLSSAYFTGKLGLPKDHVQARHWLEKIDPAEYLNGDAPHTLGIIYYKGLGVPVDRRRAFAHFRRAALLGKVKSKWVVAMMMGDGNGTLRKPAAAKVIYRHCAKDRRINFLLRLNFWLLSYTG